MAEVVGGSRVKRKTGIVESRSEMSRLMHQGAQKNDCKLQMWEWMISKTKTETGTGYFCSVFSTPYTYDCQ